MKKLLLLKIAANNKAIKIFNLYFKYVKNLMCVPHRLMENFKHFTANLKRQGEFQSLMNNTD